MPVESTFTILALSFAVTVPRVEAEPCPLNSFPVPIENPVSGINPSAPLPETEPFMFPLLDASLSAILSADETSTTIIVRTSPTLNAF